ncbi:MAG: ribosome maturation factor [Balneolaceae bacterium]|nr:MAG: ribosome maturation factor [Balneolaceae bacterium]
MINKDLDAIKQIAGPIVEAAGLFLVDVEIKHQKIPELWILVDSEHEGVNLDSCSKISNELGNELDENSSFQGRFRLNVSSPGLSRPLSDNRQYPKNKGRQAKVKFTKEDNYHSIEGVISDVTNTHIFVQTPDGNITEIPFGSLVETKIIPKIS